MNYFTMNHIIMRKSLFFVVVVIFSQFLVAKSEKPPDVLCAFKGIGSKVVISDIPDRCKGIAYGYFFFDECMSEEDKSTLKSLGSSYKDLYVMVAFMNAYDWKAITDKMDPNDKNLASLQTFVSDYKISGLILDGLGIFDGTTQNYAGVVNELVCRIKTNSPTLTIGVLLNGYEDNLYGEKDRFDFSVASTMVDFFVIDMQTTTSPCFPNTTTRFSMTTRICNITTMEQVFLGVTLTGLDKTKVFFNFDVSVNFVDNGALGFKTYSEYCDRTVSATQTWCADSIEIFYDLVTYFKPLMSGIILSYLDDDDSIGTCECDKYPIVNTYIDSLESKPIKCCPKIAGLT